MARHLLRKALFMEPDTGPSLRSLVALLTLTGMVMTLLTVLYITTPIAARPDVWALLKTSGPTLLLAIPIILNYLRTGRVDKETTAQSHTLAKIEANTNGVLDRRIANGVNAVLDARGVGATPDTTIIPEQLNVRNSDPG